jgi:hypothetical protein
MCESGPPFILLILGKLLPFWPLLTSGFTLQNATQSCKFAHIETVEGFLKFTMVNMPRFLKLGGTPSLLLLSDERQRYGLQDELGKDRVSVHRIPKASHA